MDERAFYLKIINTVMMGCIMLSMFAAMSYTISNMKDLFPEEYSNTTSAPSTNQEPPTRAPRPPSEEPFASGIRTGPGDDHDARHPADEDPTDWGTVGLAVSGVIGVCGLTGAGAYGTRRAWRSRKARHEAVRARRKKWKSVNDRYGKVASEYTEFEMNPRAVLFTKRELADITDPYTSDFHERFSAMQDLLPESMPNTSEEVDSLVSAVSALEVSWRKANENAERKSHLWLAKQSAKALSDICKAEKLVCTAMDDACTPEASKTYVERAIALLDGAGVRYPNGHVSRAMLAIEKKNQRALRA